MSILLETDGPCYDPDLYASLGDDARKAERENAVTEAHEGGGGDDGTNDTYFAQADDEPRFWWYACDEEYTLHSTLQPSRPVFGICDEQKGGYIVFTTEESVAEDITRLLAKAYDGGR